MEFHDVLCRKCLIIVLLFQCLEAHSHNIQQEDPDTPSIQVQTFTIGGHPDNKIHVIQYSNIPNTIPGEGEYDASTLDTWSVVWYIASFGGLILFFLIVSCSEWCCRRNAQRNCQRSNSINQSSSQVVPDTPPPSYDQFAPPAYEELWVGNSRGPRGEKSEYDIYVVPVHALGTIIEEARREEAPPSYQSASAALAHPVELPRVHSSSSRTVT